MKDMHVFERDVNGRRYRIAAQSVWDPVRGRSVARQIVLGPATAAPVADLGATRTLGTRAVGEVGALVWVAEQLDLIGQARRCIDYPTVAGVFARPRRHFFATATYGSIRSRTAHTRL